MYSFCTLFMSVDVEIIMWTRHGVVNLFWLVRCCIVVCMLQLVLQCSLYVFMCRQHKHTNTGKCYPNSICDALDKQSAVNTSGDVLNLLTCPTVATSILHTPAVLSWLHSIQSSVCVEFEADFTTSTDQLYKQTPITWHLFSTTTACDHNRAKWWIWLTENGKWWCCSRHWCC